MTRIDEGVIAEAIDLLSPPEREVILLRHITGLSLEELTSALGVKLSAAKMRLYRAEEKLLAAYKQVAASDPATR